MTISLDNGNGSDPDIERGDPPYYYRVIDGQRFSITEAEYRAFHERVFGVNGWGFTVGEITRDSGITFISLFD